MTPSLWGWQDVRTGALDLTWQVSFVCLYEGRVFNAIHLSFTEVAFVGKAPGSYLMLLGGGYYGQRLNKIYRGELWFLLVVSCMAWYSFSSIETVSEPEILDILGPMIKRYALERHEGERFGDWTIRAGYIAPTTSGKEWYDRMGGEEQFEETVTVS